MSRHPVRGPHCGRHDIPLHRLKHHIENCERAPQNKRKKRLRSG
jgi:hypothetical protein